MILHEAEAKLSVNIKDILQMQVGFLSHKGVMLPLTRNQHSYFPRAFYSL